MIPTELEVFVEQEVASGKFRSRDEVVAEALRLLNERERRRVALLADLQIGINELDQGKGIAGVEVFARLRERASEIERNAS